MVIVGCVTLNVMKINFTFFGFLNVAIRQFLIMCIAGVLFPLGSTDVGGQLLPSLHRAIISVLLIRIF